MKLLFVGRTVYRRPFEASLKKKWAGLSRGQEIDVIARGSKNESFQESGVTFHLIKENKIEFLDVLHFVSAAQDHVRALGKSFDVIVAEDPLVSGWVGVALKKQLRAKLVIECHGDWQRIHAFYRKRLFPSVVNAFASWLARYALLRADAVRVVSAYLEKKVRAIHPNMRVFSFPAFMDLQLFFDIPSNASPENILFVGDLFRVKGVDVLLNAWAQVEKQGKGAVLHVVGDGPEKNFLQAQANRLGLSSSVVFHGRLLPQRVCTLLETSRCLVLPSRSEGFGRVVVEAMAAGRPVVVSDAGALPELVQDGETGFVVPAGDAHRLAEKIGWIVDNPGQAQALGKNARAEARQRFSGEGYFAAYRALFLEVAESKGI